MKPTLIAAVMLAATIYLAPRAKAQRYSNEAQKYSQTEAKFYGQEIASLEYGGFPTEETESGEDRPPHWYKSPEWLLVIVGFVTCIVVGIQSWATAESAKATKKATEGIERQAGIMERQTDVLLGSERAWLTAGLMRQATEKEDGRWYWTDRPDVPLTVEEAMSGLHFGYKLRVTNIGRTAAQVYGFELRYSCLGKDVTELPSQSGDQLCTDNIERTIKADGSAEILYTKINGYMARDRQRIDALESTAIFHGWVKYRPIIDPSEDSFADYCYVYSPSQKVLVRRDEYNTQKHQTKKSGSPN
jgi:hypothetical protein